MRKILLILIVFLVLAVSQGICSSGVGTTAAAFLKLPQGNRATAMGGNFTAFAEGPTALYWNPAGLANGYFNEARFVYNNYIEGLYYCYAAYRHNIAGGGFGVAATYLTSGAMDKRTNSRESLGTTYTLENMALNVGQGLKVTDDLNVGVLLKFIYEMVDGEAINGMSGGFGLQYHKEINEHNVYSGISLMNFGTRMGHDEKFHLPSVVRTGIGDELMNGRLRGSVECDYYIHENKILGGVGGEFQAAPFLDLRLGYKFGYEDIKIPYGLTAGFGIRYIEDVEYVFDYSFSTVGDLGYVNRVGVGVRF
jgi:hypothetical protein